MSGPRPMLRFSAILVAAAFMAGVAPAAGEDSRWALTARACSGEETTRDETPIIIDRTEIRWFDRACRIVSSYKVGETHYLQGECRSAERTAVIPLMLKPENGRLLVGWNREPVRSLHRCRWVDGSWQ